MNNVAIYTEAGDGIGLGHVTRCSAIGAAMARSGATVRMYIDIVGSATLPLRENWSVCDWLSDVGCRANNAVDRDIAIVDSYRAPAALFEALKRRYRVVIALDDYNRMAYPADMIINPNVFGDRIDYSEQATIILGGSDYVILREAILASPRRSEALRNDVRTVVVMVGGSDYRNLLPRLCARVCDMAPNLHVIAADDKYRDRLRSMLPGPQYRFYGHLDEAAMADVLSTADIAISGGGQTLNELAYLGIPTIGLCIDADQEWNIRIMYQCGFLYDYFAWDTDQLDTKLRTSLTGLKNPAVRAQKSQIGRELVTGNGAQKIAAAALAALKSESQIPQ